MKKISLCKTCATCPTLAMHQKGKKVTFVLTDDYGGEVQLTTDEARNLALAIFKEVGKK